jgi:luciferase family oxidoreductase group 1
MAREGLRRELTTSLFKAAPTQAAGGEPSQDVRSQIAQLTEELQAKVGNLSRATNDMNNLLAGTGIATIFVDHSLRILRFTPSTSLRLAVVVHDSSDAMTVQDPDGCIIAWNRSALSKDAKVMEVSLTSTWMCRAFDLPLLCSPASIGICQARHRFHHNEQMIKPENPRLSMLDLVAVREGGTVAQALALALRTAQHAEMLGFTRYWLAEHHNMPSIASSATAVLVGHIAGGTQRIRVGSGGIMLPNHAPLVVAEAFGTLAELYPDRIDLGLGRAPGTDAHTMRALRRNQVETEQDFPREVAELQNLLADPTPGQRLVANPGAGTHVPIWLLGSSLFSARLAAERGLPYAFASHFAPQMMMQAIEVYRSNFRPSATLAKPYVAVGVPLVAATTDEEAQFLASSVYQRVLGILTGERKMLQPPVENYVDQLSERERSAIAEFLAMAVIGGPETVSASFAKLWEITGADEFILVCDVFEPALRMRSLDIARQAWA